MTHLLCCNASPRSRTAPHEANHEHALRLEYTPKALVGQIAHYKQKHLLPTRHSLNIGLARKTASVFFLSRFLETGEADGAIVFRQRGACPEFVEGPLSP